MYWFPVLLSNLRHYITVVDLVGLGGKATGSGSEGDARGSFELELLAVPKATAVTPSWAPSSGGVVQVEPM